jgi:hypothetical protein
VRPALCQLLDVVGHVPTLVLGRRTDVLAGNHLAFLLQCTANTSATGGPGTGWPRGPQAPCGSHYPVVGDLELNLENLELPDDPDQVLRVLAWKPCPPSADSLTRLGSFGAGAPTQNPLRAAEDTDVSDAAGPGSANSVPTWLLRGSRCLACASACCALR